MTQENLAITGKMYTKIQVEMHMTFISLWNEQWGLEPCCPMGTLGIPEAEAIIIAGMPKLLDCNTRQTWKSQWHQHFLGYGERGNKIVGQAIRMCQSFLSKVQLRSRTMCNQILDKVKVNQTSITNINVCDGLCYPALAAISPIPHALLQ